MAGEAVGGDSGSNWGDSSDSVVQLIVDQIEELIITIFEEVRARPAVAVAILAGVVGAVVGSTLAARLARRRRPPPVSAPGEVLGALVGTLGGVPWRVDGRAAGKAASGARKRARQGVARAGAVGDMADLAGLGLRLLENPIVRSYARAAVAKQLRKRFS